MSHIRCYLALFVATSLCIACDLHFFASFIHIRHLSLLVFLHIIAYRRVTFKDIGMLPKKGHCHELYGNVILYFNFSIRTSEEKTRVKYIFLTFITYSIVFFLLLLLCVLAIFHRRVSERIFVPVRRRSKANA